MRIGNIQVIYEEHSVEWFDKEDHLGDEVRIGLRTGDCAKAST